MGNGNQIGGINVGIGLDLSALAQSTAEVGKLFETLQRKISAVSLDGAVKGNPFSGQNKYLSAFGASLDAAVKQLGNLDDILIKTSGTAPGSKQITWFANLEKQVEDVSRALDNLSKKQKTVTAAVPKYIADAKALLNNQESWTVLPNTATTKATTDKTSSKQFTDDAIEALNKYKKALSDVEAVEANIRAKKEGAATKLPGMIDTATKALDNFKLHLDKVGSAGGDIAKLRTEFENLIPKQLVEDQAEATDPQEVLAAVQQVQTA